ncbi:hypothetical protein DSO57_1032736 [Entomophthora muscae]|uniref:Uncharacterized protein n=1 Tax=Entomophthora muscae TaxID=34485 RepID=A0ACC2TMN6_9FUNG|nr:hypothetical protein DSO57_1032736 [Entomophthora muscae]
MGNFICSILAQQLGLQEGPSAWVILANKSRIQNGVTSSIPFDHTGHEGILTPEDTINVLATLEEITQPQIPSKLQDLAEAFSESSCSQLPSCQDSDLKFYLVPGSVPTWGKLYPVNRAQT